MKSLSSQLPEISQILSKFTLSDSIITPTPTSQDSLVTKTQISSKIQDLLDMTRGQIEYLKFRRKPLQTSNIVSRHCANPRRLETCHHCSENLQSGKDILLCVTQNYQNCNRGVIFEFRYRQEIFLFSTPSRPSKRPTQPPGQCLPSASLPTIN